MVKFGDIVFSDTVKTYWADTLRGERFVCESEHFSLTETSKLDDGTDGMILEATDRTHVTLRSSLAKLFPDRAWTAPGFRHHLSQIGVKCHGADHLFYFPNSALVKLVKQDTPRDIRLLTEDDSQLFETFCSKSSEADLDAAYVELDHWLVAGAFENGELVSAASMYPWNESRLADTGILTLPHVRGRGYARSLLQTISHFALERGFEPQYRCQLDNLPSVALARSCGLVEFGRWDVILPR